MEEQISEFNKRNSQIADTAELLQQEGMQVTIAELPVGKDPAEIMRCQNGREIFDGASENAKSIKEFAEEKNPWTFSALASVWCPDSDHFENGEWQAYQTTVTAYVTDDEYELLRLYRENNCSFYSIAELYDLREKVYDKAYDQENARFLAEHDEEEWEYVTIDEVDF